MKNQLENELQTTEYTDTDLRTCGDHATPGFYKNKAYKEEIIVDNGCIL